MESWIEIRPLIVAEGVTRRRAEGEAWRAIVRERLGADVRIGYNERGAPVILPPVARAEKEVAFTRDERGVEVARNKGEAGAPLDKNDAADLNETCAPRCASEHSPETGIKKGAPEVGGAGGFLSVSHTKGWVAVVWSAAGPCAIDIEPRDRKISAAVAARYSIDSVARWCALEAAYKYESVAGVAPDPARITFPPHPTLTIALIL
jgi:hypothetical protein